VVPSPGVQRLNPSSPPALLKASSLLQFLLPKQLNTCAVSFFRSDLHHLAGPTVLYEDNASAIRVINNNRPTERSRHIDIAWFAIQDWRAAGDIVLKHIKGTLNPSDDLTKALGWILHAPRHA
jgi:hypothetical protein